MLLISATQITKEESDAHEIECRLIDYAALYAAELANSYEMPSCKLSPEWAVTIRPADDMIIPIFLCTVHFGALKLSLHEGVAVDEDIFGEFPNSN